MRLRYLGLLPLLIVVVLFWPQLVITFHYFEFWIVTAVVISVVLAGIIWAIGWLE